jgi:hypothetical protein
LNQVALCAIVLLSAGAVRAAELGVEGDLELAHEAQDGESATEITFDEVGVSLEGEWWRAELGIKYRSEGGRGIAVEDAALRVGGVEQQPWFAEAGRITLPFGESDSPFGEDPLVTVIGEVWDEALVSGFAGEAAEFSFGAFRGELSGGGEPGFVTSATIRPAEEAALHVSWCSDLSESVELREVREDGLDEGGLDEDAPQDAVGGLASGVTLQLDAVAFGVQYLSALETFAPGWLSRVALTPSAWNLEAAASPAERWEIAGRLEFSRDFPENPSRQWGAAASYELSEQAAVTAEYLRGTFRDGIPARDLVGLKLALSL